MAYATSNPPRLLVPAFTGNGNVWRYDSADAAATVRVSGYITNGGNLGMKVGDTVISHDTNLGITSTMRVVTVSATAPGAVDLGDASTIGSATNSD